MILHGYWRSSAAYRVRIALNLKQLGAQHVFHHLRKNEQRELDYLRLNPQGLVPTLELDAGRGVLTQSLAICEWLEETHPEPPLLPGDLIFSGTPQSVGWAEPAAVVRPGDVLTSYIEGIGEMRHRFVASGPRGLDASSDPEEER